MRDLSGQQLGQYKIVKMLAKGGMAAVYLAEQASMNRYVAIKVLPSNFTHDDTFIERFNREVAIISSLQHPHILPVYDFGEFEEMPYIVMAYLSGGTLGDKMQQGAMSSQEMLRTVRQIADALDFAHSKKIIHRDLKPANFLLDERGNVYLADFGLARLTESASNLTGTYVLGTPAYMAPEQASSMDVTPSVDVYAFGAAVYQMLLGQPPFTAPTPTATMMAHMMQPIPKVHTIRPDLPQSMQHVFECVLAKEPEERFATAGDFVDAFEQALMGTAANLPMQAEAVTALLMTNMVGHVIFIDNQALHVLKRHQSEARNIIGKPLHDVLGFDRSKSISLMQTIETSGAVNDEPLTITDAKGSPHDVLISALATRDEDSKFVGADFQLTIVPDTDNDFGSVISRSVAHPQDTREENYLQDYFKAQVEGLSLLLKQWGGRKMASSLEEIINETGQRNVWPVEMQDGYITLHLSREDTDIYRALLARAISYSASMIGEKFVIRELNRLNSKIDPMVLKFAQRMGLDQLYEEILS